MEVAIDPAAEPGERELRLVTRNGVSNPLAFLVGLLISLLPTFVLSGFIFPIASMPVPIQVVTYIVPARYFLVALRGILLKGIGFGILAGKAQRCRFPLTDLAGETGARQDHQRTSHMCRQHVLHHLRHQFERRFFDTLGGADEEQFRGH